MRVLVTGGTGFIGSHTVIELMAAGHDVVIMDNYHNSKPEALRRTEAIVGSAIPFYEVELNDKAGIDAIFDKHDIDAVIHFAGLKAVGESVAKPLFYYRYNIAGTVNLLEVMTARNCKKIVFSSSATVYGDPKVVPITEDSELNHCNPYGRTKLFIEEILRDVYTADNEWEISLLRYFNPVGAHASGTIGEDPNGIPNNLMPYIAQVATGKLEQLRVFGGDYNTHDGTGVRDYIHVVDLANGHLKALDKFDGKHGCVAYNLGTGKGSSVLDMLKAFEKASGKTIAHEIVDRRPGDAAVCYADPAFAEKELGWKATRTVDDMCVDTWRWQSQNPNGME